MERWITSGPAVCGGQPTFRGTRIPVCAVLDFPSSGDTIEKVLEEYPELTREATLAALEYAAVLARDESTPV